ncbi:MAG: S9 family peptidase [Thermoanaerobaculia bacterium]
MKRRHKTLSTVALIATFTCLPALAEVERREVNNGNVVLEGVPEIPASLTASIDRYLEVRDARFTHWSADGSAIFVTTRFGNVRQLHRVGGPGAFRQQLTFFEEPISGIERQPNGDRLTFLMDEGGSEFSQIFLLDPASGESRQLSDGESRNRAVEWNRAGNRIAFQSTRRNGRSNDIWITDVNDPGSASLALEAGDGSWWGANDWSADDGRLLIGQYVSVTDSRIHLLDLGSGERRLLAGSESEPSKNLGVAPAFAADGEGIFLATDLGSNVTRLAYLSLSTGEIETITNDITWDVDDFAMTDDRTRAAFVVNQDGVDRLYLLEPNSRAYVPVRSLPVGLIGGLSFSPQGDRLALTLNTAKTPSDVFVLELGEGALDSGELVRWTYSEVGGLDTEWFSEPELVHYPTFDEVGGAARQIPAFVYRPEGDGPFPVIVSIHGGPEGQYRPSFRSTVQMWIAELGVAVIAPNVRGSSGYGREYVGLDNGFQREDSVKDIGALLDWIGRQPDLDSSKVAVYGGSYGGYMVLASLVHYSDRLKAAVDIVGISNFVTFLENTQDYRRDLRRVEYGDERDAEMREFLQRISPSNNVDKISAPLFVAQGQNDPRVPVTESEQIVKAVREAGHDVWYMNALNEGHGFRKKENSDLYRATVVLFFKKHLLGL